ncbi:MAG TPA: SGNH/GDSL hydrolase family protein, partial [Chthonomonadales bacterium]|nr:SGNH/GDSL hydrolase family protein [Chthonomonadales bacterium]
GSGAFLYEVMTPGGTMDTTTPPVRPIFEAFGHSIVAGELLDNMSEVYYQAMAQAHGYAIVSRGQPGSTFKEFPSGDPKYTSNTGQARVSEITSVQPKICIIDYFTNDLRDQPGDNPQESVTDLQAALQTTLPQLKAQCPNTHFYVLGLLDLKGRPRATQSLWDNMIQGVVQSLNSPNWTYINQEGVIDPTVDTVDGTHPNIQGSLKVAAHLEPLIQW